MTAWIKIGLMNLKLRVSFPLLVCNTSHTSLSTLKDNGRNRFTSSVITGHNLCAKGDMVTLFCHKPELHVYTQSVSCHLVVKLVFE